MVSSCRNNGTISQELRYPFTGTVVQFWQESSAEHPILQTERKVAFRTADFPSFAEQSYTDVFCKCKFLKFADKNGEFCISVLEKVAGCPAGLPDAS